MPKKYFFTQTQIDAFMRSERSGLNGIGFNDSWNMDNFGITWSEAEVIRKRIVDKYGLRSFWPKKILASDIG